MALSQADTLARAHGSKRAQFLDEFASWQQFFEDFLSLGNGWLLLVTTGVALFSLMLDVHNASIWALTAWALSQIFGVDLQFVVAIVRAGAAYRQGRGGAVVLWVLLALILAVAIWQAVYAFGVENATGMSEAQVFASWGMSVNVWLGWRAFLVILLMMVAALTRHSRTVTEAHFLSSGSPVPPDGGGLPVAAAAEPVPVFALAQAQAPAAPTAKPARNRPQTTGTQQKRDPRTARPQRLTAQQRAERERFAQLYFQQNPAAGPSDLAQALNIRPGGTVQRLWEKYGTPAPTVPTVPTVPVLSATPDPSQHDRLASAA